MSASLWLPFYCLQLPLNSLGLRVIKWTYKISALFPFVSALSCKYRITSPIFYLFPTKFRVAQSSLYSLQFLIFFLLLKHIGVLYSVKAFKLYLLTLFVLIYVSNLLSMQVEAAKGFLAVLRDYLDTLCSNLRSHTITNVQSNNDKVCPPALRYILSDFSSFFYIYELLLVWNLDTFLVTVFVGWKDLPMWCSITRKAFFVCHAYTKKDVGC